MADQFSEIANWSWSMRDTPIEAFQIKQVDPEILGGEQAVVAPAWKPPSIDYSEQYPDSDPPQSNDVLGPLSRVKQDDATAFDGMYELAVEQYKPQSVIEDALLRDFADLTIEVERLRRMEIHIVGLLALSTLDGMLQGLVADASERRKIIRGWDNGDDAAIARVRSLLPRISDITLEAAAFFEHMDKFIKLGAMIDHKRKVRDDALKTLDIHRTQGQSRARSASIEWKNSETLKPAPASAIYHRRLR